MTARTTRMIMKAALLGDGLIWKVKIFCIVFSRLVRAKMNIRLRPVRLHLCLNGISFDVYLRERQEDFWVFNEVFIEEEYKITEVIDPRIVIDAGGNIGLAALYFSVCFPKATIYTIEPDPITFLHLQKNIKQRRNIISLQAALGRDDGSELIFFQNERSVSSSLRRRSPTDQEVRVRSVSLDGLMRLYGIAGIDICKFDIEGGEADIFTEENLKKIHFCIGEAHTDLMTMSREDFLGIFSRFTVYVLDLSKDRFIIRALTTHSHTSV